MTSEVTVVTDLPIFVCERLFAIIADCGVGVMRLLLRSEWFHGEVGDHNFTYFFAFVGDVFVEF